MLKAFIISTFLISTASANFNVSYEVYDCNLSKDLCSVEVTFTKAATDFSYINTCHEIDPNSEFLQYCIEDLEVRASRVYNNQ